MGLEELCAILPEKKVNASIDRALVLKALNQMRRESLRLSSWGGWPSPSRAPCVGTRFHRPSGTARPPSSDQAVCPLVQGRAGITLSRSWTTSYKLRSQTGS